MIEIVRRDAGNEGYGADLAALRFRGKSPDDSAPTLHEMRVHRPQASVRAATAFVTAPSAAETNWIP